MNSQTQYYDLKNNYKMRRSLFLLCLAFIFFIGQSAKAEVYSGVDGNISWNLNTVTGVLTISGDGVMNDFTTSYVRDWDDYYTKAPWLIDHDPDKLYLVKTLVINDGVTSIGNNAFKGFSNISSISIPNSITSIGDYAFTATHESFILPDRLTRIGECAFGWCDFSSIEIPNSVISIGDNAFTNCRWLKSVSMQGSKPCEIGNDIFESCSSLQTIYVPLGTSEAYKSASGWSKYAEKIEETNIAAGQDGNIYWMLDTQSGLLTISGTGAMKDYSKTYYPGIGDVSNAPWVDCNPSNIILIKSVVINEGVTSIGDYVFKNHLITSVDIPNSVTKIGNFAFYGCGSLKDVTVKGSTPCEIFNTTFAGCTSLKSIHVPYGTAEIYQNALGWSEYVDYIVEAMEKDEAGVYQIGTAQNLVDFAALINDETDGVDNSAACAVLTADIDLKDVAPWTPIGTFTRRYKGTFDGQFHAIKNMALDPTKKEQGFFGAVDSATIKYVTIDKSCTVHAVDVPNVAALVAGCQGNGGKGTLRIIGCVNYADVTGWQQNNSAFLGCNYGGLKSVEVIYCANYGNVSGGWENGAFSGWFGGGSTGKVYGSINLGSIADHQDSLTLGRGTGIADFVNCYDLNEANEKCTYQFRYPNYTNEIAKSGQLCYDLNCYEGLTGWYQNLGEDEFPTLDPTHKQVYAAGENYCDGTPKGTYTYTNDASTTVKTDAHQFENGYCKNCHAIDPNYHESDDIIATTDISTFDYVLYIPDAEVNTGSEAELQLNLKNATEDITAFECKVYLPEGMEWDYTIDKRGNKVYTLPTFNEDRTDASYHTINAIKQMSDGGYYVIVYSGSNEYILETEGTILNIPVIVAEDAESGDYNIFVKNIVITDVNAIQTLIDQTVSKLTILDYTIGDANNDGMINITDVVTVISYMLEENPASFVFKAGDVNADGMINVTDVVGIINIMTADVAAAPALRANILRMAAAAAGNSLEIVPFTIAPGTTSKSVTLDLINPGDEFTAFECKVYLPEGISWESTVDKRGNTVYTQPTFNAVADRTDASYHTINKMKKMSDDGFYVIVYSDSKKVFLEEEGALLNLPLVFDTDLEEGVYDIRIGDIVLTRPDVSQELLDDYTASVVVGSPMTSSVKLHGDYSEDAIKALNSVLSEDAAINSIDFSEAFALSSNVAITTANPNAVIYVAEGMSAKNENNVVEGDVCANLVLTDGKPFGPAKTFTAMTAEYSRTLSADTYGTIVLPFAPDAEALKGYTFYELTDVETNALTFDEVSSPVAGKPYIVTSDGTATKMSAEAESTVVVEPAATEADGWTMTGTYESVVFTDADELANLYCISGNQFKQATSKLTMNPFRAYFVGDGSAKSIELRGDDGTTRIIDLTEDAQNGMLYDVLGRKVEIPAQGIYIQNGKKTLVK